MPAREPNSYPECGGLLTMSARDEIKTLMEAAVASFNNGDPTAFVNLLDDDLEVFDHAPFRFDSKADFPGLVPERTGRRQNLHRPLESTHLPRLTAGFLTGGDGISAALPVSCRPARRAA